MITTTTTPPLSQDALSVLVRAEVRPVLTGTVNPGIVHKLTLEGWAKIVSVPSPYKSHRPGTTVPALVTTDAGRARIAFEERDHG